MPTSKDRPSHRDDDVIWLAERTAGLTHDQGVGTEADALPRGIPASDVTHNLRDDETGLDATAEIVLQMPATTRQWWLRSMTMHPTAGSATLYKARIGQVAGFDDDGPDNRLTRDVSGITTPVDDVYCSPIPMRTDEEYRLYFRPGFDAGADNEITYQFWFDQRFETSESSA